MPKDKLGFVGIDVRDRMPPSVGEEDPTGDDRMDMRIPFERGAEGLDDGDHAGPCVGLIDSAHHLTDGFVGESCEITLEALDGAGNRVSTFLGSTTPIERDVLALESLFPHGLDVIVVGLEESVQLRKLWLSRTVQRWLWLRREGCGARLHKSGSKAKRVPSLAKSR